MEEQVLAVQRMQDYIAAHLENEITLSDLARVSLFSPWHSHRLFRQYTGLTPAAYIRSLRLSRSAMRLKSGSYRVTEAALDCGFDSMEGYARAFFRQFGTNPGEYTRNPVPIPLFIPYGAKFRGPGKDGIHMENLQTVFVSIVQKPDRKAIIKRGVSAEDYFPYCEEVGCGVWGILKSMDSLCGEPVCLWLTEAYRKAGTSVYVQGVEVPSDYDGPIPDGFDVIDLPAAEYLMFQGEPFQEEFYREAIFAVQHAMNRYDPSIIGFRWDESVPRIQLEPIGTRGYIELKAVKRIQKE